MYRKIGIASAILLAMSILIGFVGLPRIIHRMIKSQINLKPGSETRQVWEKYPFSMNFAIYVFNVTNAEETQNGGKPKLQEVGPFVFEEWKDKYDLQDIEDEDAVIFNMRNTFIFRPDLGLSGEEVITLSHPLIQVMSIATKRDKPPLMNLIAQGLEAIFKPTTAFINAPFMDIFYRGIDVDCSMDHLAAIAICMNFHSGAIKGGVKVDETHFKFSLMGTGNHSDAGRFKVARGIKDSHDIGRVLQFDENDELSVWNNENGEECNRFRGTDGTVFPPLLKPAEGLWSFSTDLCRSLVQNYEKKVSYAGISALRYVMDFGDVKNETVNHCFCKKYPDDCPAKGTMDLSLCTETPMIASLPHFLNGDTKLIEDVDGLNPQEEKHGIYIDFERISGTPLNLAKRLQFSLSVEPIPEVAVMKDLKPLIMPLFWVEESLQLDKTFTDMLKKKVLLIFKVNNIVRWIAAIMGACGVLMSVYMLQGSETIINKVTTVDTTTNDGNTN